ncbi:MAG: hypothetical protein NC823_02410, partial [Candidatus Omnitrophica bacterium]|nr:hypothetical protein [Candidatus Omnitrophota bacterium]
DLQGKTISNPKAGDYYLNFSPGYRLPVRFSSGEGKTGTALVVDEKGKDSRWSMSQEKKLRKKVSQVMAIDVFNCGQLRTCLKPCKKGIFLSRSWRYYTPDIYHATDAFMAGSSPLTLAMEEIMSLLVSLKATRDSLIFSGRGWPAVGLILLSAILPKVEICLAEGIPSSYQGLFASGYFWFNINLVIPGFLRYTDLPAIISANRKTHYYLRRLLKSPKRSNYGPS